MSERPSFKALYMNFAVGLSERSTCVRTNSKGELMKVGCVITSVDWRYVYGCGYNGNATGLTNQCDSSEPGRCGCIHSEANAVINCRAARSEEKIVLCTHLPCTACAKMLINLGGVKQVYYLNDYRIRDSVKLFDRVGIVIEQFTP